MFLCPRCGAGFSDAWGAGQCRDQDDADQWPRLARRAAALPRRVPGIPRPIRA